MSSGRSAAGRPASRRSRKRPGSCGRSSPGWARSASVCRRSAVGWPKPGTAPAPASAAGTRPPSGACSGTRPISGRPRWGAGASRRRSPACARSGGGLGRRLGPTRPSRQPRTGGSRCPCRPWSSRRCSKRPRLSSRRTGGTSARAAGAPGGGGRAWWSAAAAATPSTARWRAAGRVAAGRLRTATIVASARTGIASAGSRRATTVRCAATVWNSWSGTRSGLCWRTRSASLPSIAASPSCIMMAKTESKRSPSIARSRACAEAWAD